MGRKLSTLTNELIIAGDWVVDEYWYLVRHHSEISTHTGFVHYRSSSKPTERILDLCGAGHVARVLYALRSESKQAHTIWGVGDWNEDDTEHLLHLVHGQEMSECPAPLANFSLKRKLCRTPPENIHLQALHPDRQTNRVVRQYHSTGSGIDQISRVDWELPRSEDSGIDENRLGSFLPNARVKSIVIHDLHKGAVVPALVEFLVKRYPLANWYVRTKNPNPTWLLLIQERLALFLMGPESSEPTNPWSSWLIGRKITLKSFELLRREMGRATVVLSEKREVVGRTKDGKCITIKAPLPDTAEVEVGWPSALFAALVHTMHTEGEELDDSKLEDALKHAHSHAALPVPSEQGRLDLETEKLVIYREDWADQETQWQQALTDLGIIQEEGARLEVWRGASDLPGYVACIERKRELIGDIGRRLRAFVKRGSDSSRSLSILLQADPGSGKTHLARLLAQQLDLSLLHFDVTQMLHREDLLDLFDTVATEQANNPEQQVLVFVDEINAHIAGAAVYTSFLAPLEQGVYVRGGRVFSLRPCAWIFAGTDSEKEEQPKSVKISDFEQRLTTKVLIDYQSLISEAGSDQDREDVRSKAKLEQVYLGATMIQQRYPDVKIVSRSVLRIFHDLDPEESPSRKIRKIVEEFRNVQYGRVTIKNVAPEREEDSESDLVTLAGRV